MYSNTKYEDEILKLITKSTTQKVMAKYIFGHRLHDLEYFEVGFLFILLVLSIKLREPLQKFEKY